MTLRERFTPIIREIFEQPDLVLSDDLGPRNVPNWNSFTFLSLILRLEEELGCELPPDEVQSVNVAGDLLRIAAVAARMPVG